MEVRHESPAIGWVTACDWCGQAPPHGYPAQVVLDAADASYGIGECRAWVATFCSSFCQVMHRATWMSLQRQDLRARIARAIRARDSRPAMVAMGELAHRWVVEARWRRHRALRPMLIVDRELPPWDVRPLYP